MVLCQDWALGMSRLFLKAGQLEAMHSEGRTDFVVKLLSWGENFFNDDTPLISDRKMLFTLQVRQTLNDFGRSSTVSSGAAAEVVEDLHSA